MDEPQLSKRKPRAKRDNELDDLAEYSSRGGWLNQEVRISISPLPQTVWRPTPVHFAARSRDKLREIAFIFGFADEAADRMGLAGAAAAALDIYRCECRSESS